MERVDLGQPFLQREMEHRTLSFLALTTRLTGYVKVITGYLHYAVCRLEGVILPEWMIGFRNLWLRPQTRSRFSFF